MKASPATNIQNYHVRYRRCLPSAVSTSGAPSIHQNEWTCGLPLIWNSIIILINTALQSHWMLSKSEVSPRIWICVTRPSCVHVCRVWVRDYRIIANRLLMIFMTYSIHLIMVFMGDTVSVQLERGSVLSSASACQSLNFCPTLVFLFSST